MESSSVAKAGFKLVGTLLLLLRCAGITGVEHEIGFKSWFTANIFQTISLLLQPWYLVSAANFAIRGNYTHENIYNISISPLL